MAGKRDIATLSPNQLIEYTLQRYFRRRTHRSIDQLLDKVFRQPYYKRIQIAERTIIPEVVDALAHDVDSWVRQAARRNEYWQLLGQYKSLLNMKKSDKIQFIQKEQFRNLLVFAVFETDPDVLEALFENATVSLAHLHLIRKLLKERGFGATDDIILERLEAVLQRKKHRVSKIYDIMKFKNKLESSEALAHLCALCLDADPVVRQAAFNAIAEVPLETLQTFLTTPNPFRNVSRHSVQMWWDVVLQLERQFVRQNHIQTQVAVLTGTDDQPEAPLSFTAIKQTILEYAGTDLSNHDHFLTIVKAHLDEDPVIHEQANHIIAIDEILELVEDDTFPQAIGKKAVKILLQHPSLQLQHRLTQTLMKLSERTRKHLKEMETTINAYLDIIFNSLGYPRIQQIRHTLKTIAEARKLSEDHLKEELSNNPHLAQEAQQLRKLFTKIEQYYQQKLKDLYLTVTPSQKEELLEIYEMITIIGKIPEEVVQKEGYLFLSENGDYATQLHKARLVWRSTLGQYLGRLKEFEEMLQHKWLSILPRHTSRINFHRDLIQAQQELEQDYKRQVNCHLTIACSRCTKRICAAQRYFIQVEFLLGEMIDYLMLENEN